MVEKHTLIPRVTHVIPFPPTLVNRPFGLCYVCFKKQTTTYDLTLNAG